MSGGIELWPIQASQHAESVDLLIGSFGAMVWAFTLPVFVLMTVFAIRYRRSRKDVNRDHAPFQNPWLELSWSAIPFVLVLGFFVWSTALFLDLYRAPPDAMPIHVVAKQWMWKYQHPEGAKEINDLHVPVGMPIKLIMTSEDVIHSFYVPALRLKQDLVPGRYTAIWFKAEKEGSYPLRCAEFCGTDHSVMGGQLIVMRADNYAAWLAGNRDGGTGGTLAAQGGRLYRQLGCTGCHGANASVKAPVLAGLYGRQVALAAGGTATIDDQYLRDALLQPNKQVVAGYPPIMPTYANVLRAEQADALVEYLKGAK